MYLAIKDGTIVCATKEAIEGDGFEYVEVPDNTDPETVSISKKSGVWEVKEVKSLKDAKKVVVDQAKLKSISAGAVELLRKSGWAIASDSKLSSGKKTEWINYRVYLWDILNDPSAFTAWPMEPT